MNRWLPGALTCALLLPLPAAAQGTPQGASQGTPPAETSVPRFSFAPVEGGALKLDRETGRVSLCAKGLGGFTCEAVPDTRDAYEAEIARLQGELDALRRAAQATPPGAAAPPDASDIDQALAYAERFYRRLKGMIDELRRPGDERL